MPGRIRTHQPLQTRWTKAAQVERDRQRGSPSARGYGRRWQRLAAMYKRAHPLCADPFGVHAACGEIVSAEHVDHIVSRRRGGADEWSNLQGLCASCHARKTALVDGGFGRPPRACQSGRGGE